MVFILLVLKLVNLKQGCRNLKFNLFRLNFMSKPIKFNLFRLNFMSKPIFKGRLRQIIKIFEAYQPNLSDP